MNPLPEPRAFYHGDAINPLHQLLLQFVGADARMRSVLRSELYRELGDMLDMAEDDDIARAISASPSDEALRWLGDTLDEWLDDAGRQGQQPLRLFALPVVFVLGATSDVRLPAKVERPEAVAGVLEATGALGAGAQVAVAGNLVSPEGLERIAKSRWLSLLQAAESPAGLRAPELPGSDLFVPMNGEEVALRFMVGVARGGDGVFGDAARHGLALAHLFADQYGRDELTLFAIPRAAQPIHRALASGRTLVAEIGLQIAASSAIKKLRDQVGDPLVSIAAHTPGQIRIRFANPANLGHADTYRWNLTPTDSLPAITQIIVDLLEECRIEEVVFHSEVLAADAPEPTSKPVIWLKNERH